MGLAWGLHLAWGSCLFSGGGPEGVQLGTPPVNEHDVAYAVQHIVRKRTQRGSSLPCRCIVRCATHCVLYFSYGIYCSGSIGSIVITLRFAAYESCFIVMFVLNHLVLSSKASSGELLISIVFICIFNEEQMRWVRHLAQGCLQVD